MSATRNTMQNKHEAVLTEYQIGINVGVLLTDGCLEVSPNGKTARIIVELSVKGQTLVEHWSKLMAPFCSPVLEKFTKKPLTKGGKIREMVRVRSFFHSQFLQFEEAFGLQKSPSAKNAEKPKRIKKVPSYEYLIKYLNYEVFAIMIMMDGSVKNKKGSRAIELHVQNFSLEEQTRLCLAIYKNLGIKCWPSKYSESSRNKYAKESNTQKYHIIISGFSLPLIYEQVVRYILPEFRFKIPQLSSHVPRNQSQSPFYPWYEGLRSEKWVQDLGITLDDPE